MCLRNNLNNVPIASIVYGKIRHLRAEAKSVFHKAACGTSEVHYGLTHIQHQKGHFDLRWQKREEDGMVVPMRKEVRAVFSCKVQREMNFSVIPNKITTHLQS